MHHVESSETECKANEKVKNHTTTYLETIIHYVKAGLGAGIFAISEAISNTGLVLGAILIVILSFVCLYEQHVLLRCAKDIREYHGIKNIPDYGETFQLALTANDRWKKYAGTMKIVSNLFLILTQLGFCAVYFVFIGNTMKNVLDHYGYYFEVRLLIAVALIPITLSSLITNLKFLAPCSALAGVCMVSGIAITFYYISQDLPPLEERKLAILSISKLPLFFGTVIYIFEQIGLVLPLQREMKQPKNFTRPLGVLNIGTLILTAFVILFGLFGYWKYGKDALGTLTLNLPLDDPLAQSVKIIVSVGIALGYAIQFYIPIQILFPIMRQYFSYADRNPFLSELIFRMLLVLMTFSVAVLVPNVGLLISMIGAVCSNSLALVFPVIIEYLVVTRGDNKMSFYGAVKNILILLLAVIGLLSGGYESVLGIIKLYN